MKAPILFAVLLSACGSYDSVNNYYDETEDGGEVTHRRMVGRTPFENTWDAVGERFADAALQPLSPESEVRWGDSQNITAVFAGNGAQAVDLRQLVQIDTPARVWSLHLALTMTTPLQIPAGDNLAVFFTITAGVGSSKIQFRRFIDQTMFIPIVLPGGLVQDSFDIVVPDIAARQLLITGRSQYNNTHGATTVAYRVDAAAAPVVR